MTTRNTKTKTKTSAKRKTSNIRAHPKARQKDKLPKRLARPCIAEYVEWNYVPKIGRGVIARVDALKGTVLERSPVVVAPVADFEAKHGKMTVLDHYLLTWEEKGEDVEYAVGLGYLMLYNHSARPNAEFRYNYPAREIEMVAIKNIRSGEEITHDYGGTWFTPRKEKTEKKPVKKPAKKAGAKAKSKAKTTKRK